MSEPILYPDPQPVMGTPGLPANRGGVAGPAVEGDNEVGSLRGQELKGVKWALAFLQDHAEGTVLGL